LEKGFRDEAFYFASISYTFNEKNPTSFLHFDKGEDEEGVETVG